MRAAFLAGCAALLLSTSMLSACSSNEPPQQATAAHVPPGMRAAMSNQGQASCAMIGGTLSVARQLDGSAIGMCAMPNGKRCSENALAAGTCGAY
jgi:putative hemolysin